MAALDLRWRCCRVFADCRFYSAQIQLISTKPIGLSGRIQTALSNILRARGQFRRSRRGLLGSISLWQTRHSFPSPKALRPPQLPLMRLPMMITPNAIPSIMVIKSANASTKVATVPVPLVKTRVHENADLRMRRSHGPQHLCYAQGTEPPACALRQAPIPACVPRQA